MEVRPMALKVLITLDNCGVKMTSD